MAGVVGALMMALGCAQAQTYVAPTRVAMVANSMPWEYGALLQGGNGPVSYTHLVPGRDGETEPADALCGEVGLAVQAVGRFRWEPVGRGMRTA